MFPGLTASDESVMGGKKKKIITGESLRHDTHKFRYHRIMSKRTVEKVSNLSGVFRDDRTVNGALKV